MGGRARRASWFHPMVGTLQELSSGGTSKCEKSVLHMPQKDQARLRKRGAMKCPDVRPRSGRLDCSVKDHKVRNTQKNTLMPCPSRAFPTTRPRDTSTESDAHDNDTSFKMCLFPQKVTLAHCLGKKKTFATDSGGTRDLDLQKTNLPCGRGVVNSTEYHTTRQHEKDPASACAGA